MFDDDAALGVLNGIVHPLVREETRAQVARLPEDAVVVHDVPLIVENGMGAQFHLVVVVGASVAVRTERAIARGLSESTVIARIAAQADDRGAPASGRRLGRQRELRGAPARRRRAVVARQDRPVRRQPQGGALGGAGRDEHGARAA